MEVMSFLGGCMIGAGAALLLLFNGRIMGASGIASVFSVGFFERLQHTRYGRRELFWRSAFLAGLLLGGALAAYKLPSQFSPEASLESFPILAAAGLLVGIGTRMGWGCTSGHGVCGIARLSGRSLISTIVFILAGILTVWVRGLL